MWSGIAIIIILIGISAFFSMAEISLAASRRMRLRTLADGGNKTAERVLACQDQPGLFLTTVQIGVNAVSILAGIVGDSLLSPPIAAAFPAFVPPSVAGKIASILMFTLVTSLFVLFSDLMPKWITMTSPESIALRLMPLMEKCLLFFAPLSKSFNMLATRIFSLLGVTEKRGEDITSDDLYAAMEAGAMAGILRRQEKDLIGHVFELDSRTVPSAMTMRESVVYFCLGEDEESIRAKTANSPHSTYPVCEGDIDHVVGYVESKDILGRVLKGQRLDMTKEDMHMRMPLMIPDTLTLAEALDQFKGSCEDLAVVLNEYALVVGILSMKDIMVMLMGSMEGQEEQIVRRDEHSWLVEGATPVDDVMRFFETEEFPGSENYETIGGFLTYMLRRIPRRTDSVNFGGYRFEVVDIDNYKTDQVLVTRTHEKHEKEKSD